MPPCDCALNEGWQRISRTITRRKMWKDYQVDRKWLIFPSTAAIKVEYNESTICVLTTTYIQNTFHFCFGPLACTLMGSARAHSWTMGLQGFPQLAGGHLVTASHSCRPDAPDGPERNSDRQIIWRTSGRLVTERQLGATG